MVDINQVIILLTPFHKRAMYHLFSEAFNQESTLIFHSTIVDVSEFTCNVERMTEYDFSRRKIFKSPFKLIVPFKRKVNEIKKEIELLKEKYAFKDGLNFCIGSDKDIFTQILLSKFKKTTKSITAVDEGLGFYVRKSVQDHLIALLYFLATPVLFGQRLYYIRRLGTYPGIDTVYVRDKELLPKQKNNIEYKEFVLQRNQVPQAIPKGKILFYSFPEQDYLYNRIEKINLYKRIGGYLGQNNRVLVIKPHPREDISSLVTGLDGYENIRVLDGDFLGETLYYFEYEFIFNVFSSILLDIVSSSYPKERLFTLGFTNSPLVRFDQHLSYIPMKEFNIRKVLRFEN